MSTYENCYEILSQVRQGINEYSTGLLQGTDTSGPHQNSYLVKKINEAVKFIYAILLRRIPEAFFESTSLTGSNSVFTLPWDFGRLLYFKDENGDQVFPLDPKKGKLENETGNDRLYYRSNNTLVLDKAGVSETYTLLYYRKPRELDQGISSAGGSQSLTLATSAKLLADYYNGMKIEVITDDFVDEIADYTAARVATISGTGAASKYYGIVSDLPEPFHHLIAPKAIHLVKLESPVIQEKVTQASLQEWDRQLSMDISAYASADDIDYEDLFADYDEDGGIIML